MDGYGLLCPQEHSSPFIQKPITIFTKISSHHHIVNATTLNIRTGWSKCSVRDKPMDDTRLLFFEYPRVRHRPDRATSGSRNGHSLLRNTGETIHPFLFFDNRQHEQLNTAFRLDSTPSIPNTHTHQTIINNQNNSLMPFNNETLFLWPMWRHSHFYRYPHHTHRNAHHTQQRKRTRGRQQTPKKIEKKGYTKSNNNRDHNKAPNGNSKE